MSIYDFGKGDAVGEDVAGLPTEGATCQWGWGKRCDNRPHPHLQAAHPEEGEKTETSLHLSPNAC